MSDRTAFLSQQREHGSDAYDRIPDPSAVSTQSRNNRIKIDSHRDDDIRNARGFYDWFTACYNLDDGEFVWASISALRVPESIAASLD